MDTQFWLGSHANLSEYQARQERLDSVIASGSTAPEPGDGYMLHGNVAVIDINGPLVNTDSFWNDLFGLTSYNRIRNGLIEAASDKNVNSIVLNIDSGGGTPNGLPDVANLIRKINTAIPVTAYTAGTMASAAYWLGSAASKVYAGPTAMVGSIGVIATLMDRTKQLEQDGITPTVIRAGSKKALANPYEPVTKEVKAEVQAQIDHLYDVFVAQVAEHRGMSSSEALKAADGQEYIGEQSVKAGLVDGITSLDALVGGLQAQIETKRSKDTAMAKKHLLTEREVALIAEGVNPQAAIEGAPNAEETPPVEVPEGEAAPETAEVEEGSTEAAASITPAHFAAGGELVAFLQAELAAKTSEITQLSVKLADQDRELNVFKAHDNELKAIVAASVNRMQIGLGGKSSDLTKLSTEALLSQHSSVMSQFSQVFPIGGVAAVTTEEEEPSKAAASSPLDKARMRVVKTHK
jgi:signal peptide peptidase SppA